MLQRVAASETTATPRAMPYTNSACSAVIALSSMSNEGAVRYTMAVFATRR